MGRYYSGLLGIPPEVPAPDYYQLLGVEPDAVDEETVKTGLGRRLERLEGSPGKGSSLAQHLRRELNRARATLLDAKSREEYDEWVRQQRWLDVKRYVGELVEEGALGSTRERALLDRMESLRVPADLVQSAVDDAVGELQATRRPEPRDERLKRAAEERVLEVMHGVTDAQLIEAVGVPGTLADGEDVPAETPPEDVPVETPRSEASIWADSSQIGGRNKSAAERERDQEEVMRDERERRAARRASRSWSSLFVVAATFVGANALAILVPDLAARVEAATAGARGELVRSSHALHYALGALGTSGLLVGLLVFLAGRPGRRAFLVPTFLLALPAVYLGLVPGGQKRLLLRDRMALEARAQEAAAERDSAIGEVDSARSVADERSREMTELARRHEDESKALTQKLESAASAQEALGKKLEEQSRLAQKAAEQEPLLAERTAKIAELQKYLKTQESTILKLRAENDELKKKAPQTQQVTSK
jgi:hypothetical protein